MFDDDKYRTAAGEIGGPGLSHEEFEAWLVALESGEYGQGQGTLRNRLGPGRVTYCCLGVLCVVTGVDLDRTVNSYPLGQHTGVAMYSGEAEAMPALAKLPYDVRDELAKANDSGFSFREIAAWLRRNRHLVLASG